MSDDIKLMPIQKSRLLPRDSASVNEAVYMRAYEIYSHIFAPQPAMIKDGCRGGFGFEELVCFLYAGNFPRDQWRARMDEAFKGIKL